MIDLLTTLFIVAVSLTTLALLLAVVFAIVDADRVAAQECELARLTAPLPEVEPAPELTPFQQLLAELDAHPELRTWARSRVERAVTRHDGTQVRV
jgi:hypothetical protein